MATQLNVLLEFTYLAVLLAKVGLYPPILLLQLLDKETFHVIRFMNHTLHRRSLTPATQIYALLRSQRVPSLQLLRQPLYISLPLD